MADTGWAVFGGAAAALAGVIGKGFLDLLLASRTDRVKRAERRQQALRDALVEMQDSVLALLDNVTHRVTVNTDEEANRLYMAERHRLMRVHILNSRLPNAPEFQTPLAAVVEVFTSRDRPSLADHERMQQHVVSVITRAGTIIREIDGL